MNCTGRINQANGRLKAARVRVRIEQIGESLYLQATLPPKPTSDRDRPYQQRIALGIAAHARGVSLAEQEARKVASQLDSDEFSWEPYLKPSDRAPETAGDWLRRFEAEVKPTVTPTTWKTEYRQVLQHIPSEKPLTASLMQRLIDGTPENSRTRRRYCITLTKLARFAGLHVNFDIQKGNYSATDVDPRMLPTDDQIVEWFERIPNKSWQQAYGLMATFGLRNHEVFFLDLQPMLEGKPWIEVLKGKTGHRLAWPFHPEWVEAFDLGRVALPPVTGNEPADYGNRVTHQFDRYKVPFPPYALRHCWAIRTLEYGLDLSLAAKQMGHSIKVHSQIYHRWIDTATHQRAYNALTSRADRPAAPLPMMRGAGTAAAMPAHSSVDGTDTSVEPREDFSPDSVSEV